jgi:hypothetical protein
MQFIRGQHPSLVILLAEILTSQETSLCFPSWQFRCKKIRHIHVVHHDLKVSCLQWETLSLTMFGASLPESLQGACLAVRRSITLKESKLWFPSSIYSSYIVLSCHAIYHKNYCQVVSLLPILFRFPGKQCYKINSRSSLFTKDKRFCLYFTHSYSTSVQTRSEA